MSYNTSNRKNNRCMRMDNESYSSLKNYILQSTRELERNLLESINDIEQQQQQTSFRGAGNSVESVFERAIDDIPRNIFSRRNLTLEQLGRSVLRKAGRSVGTDIGSAVGSVLFGSATKTPLSPQQFRNDILSSLFK